MKHIWHLADSFKWFWECHSEDVGFSLWMVAITLAGSAMVFTYDWAAGLLR
jgi:hypothetical protein